MRGGSTEPARIVAGELFRSVTVKGLATYIRSSLNLSSA